MRKRRMLRFAVLACGASLIWSKPQRVPDASDPNLIHNREIEEAARLGANKRIRGSVAFSTGERPERPVEINASCPTFERLMATTDPKGKFSFSFDANRQSDVALTDQGCFLYASVEGFHSDRVILADRPMFRELQSWSLQQKNQYWRPELGPSGKRKASRWAELKPDLESLRPRSTRSNPHPVRRTESADAWSL